MATSATALCALFVGLALSSCATPTPQEQAAANEKYLAAEGITVLELGNPAPALAGLVSATGASPQLTDLLEQSPHGLVLFFLPTPEAPNAQRNLLEWQRRSASLAAAGLQLAVVCPGDPPTAATWFGRIGCKLPVYADPRGTVARAYGCLSGTGKFPQRTTVGIAPDAKVALFHRGLPTEQEILKAFGLGTEPK